jgi:thiamine biosynthesis lipoprotein
VAGLAFGAGLFAPGNARIVVAQPADSVVVRAAPDFAPRATASRARYLMGTPCTAEAEAADSAAAAAAIVAAFDEIARLEAILSSWRDDSELARLNALGAGESLACSPELYGALVAARTMAEATGGAFDPTVEPLIRAWDFRGKGRVPAEDEIAEALALVGWSGLVLDADAQSAHFAAPGMGVDLGGIGKGLALDYAFARLETAGVRRARLNFGGEVCVISDDTPWSVAVADPGDRLRPVIEFALREGAVSTSGQSERAFRAKGRTWGHILDPRTGRPVAHDGSVTVIAPSATQADALSTALFVMGRASGEVFAKAHPEIGVLWLERSGDDVHAWGWNLPETRDVAGSRLQWMDTADAR